MKPTAKYYGSGRFYFNAFTVLRCSRCGHEVMLEAHHDHLGRHKKGHFKAPGPLRCPRREWVGLKPVTGPCGSLDWRYVHTRVLLSKEVAGYTGRGAYPPGEAPRSRWQRESKKRREKHLRAREKEFRRFYREDRRRAKEGT